MGLGMAGAGYSHKSWRDREVVYREAREGDPLEKGRQCAHRLRTFCYQKVLRTLWEEEVESPLSSILPFLNHLCVLLNWNSDSAEGRGAT